jgi:hypothetical protein
MGTIQHKSKLKQGHHKEVDSSPLMFNLALDWILKTDLRIRKLLEDELIIAFADDIVLIAKNTYDAKRLASTLNKHGLVMNKEKCSYIGKKSVILDRLANRVKEFKYLGCKISRSKKSIKSYISNKLRNIL